MIPEEKQTAVKRALVEAFGVQEFEDIALLTGGLSPALAYRILVKGKPYLLRLSMRTDAYADPTGQFAVMKTAADAGIAPRIWYTSIEDKLMITDFVQAKPYPDDFALRIASLLHRLHVLPNFPRIQHFPHYLDSVDTFLRQFQAANILSGIDKEEMFQRYDEIRQVYPHSDAELVASHNDLKPQNTLFDGERIWLVDWEAAFLNDPYVDLAVVANFFVRDEAEEDAYLSTYFGEPAGGYQLARFFLIRQIVHMFYTGFLLLMASRSGTAIDAESAVPDFRAFHDRLISGEIDVDEDTLKVRYARLHLKRMLHNTRSQRFADALAAVGSVQASV
jgi:aminoglycoside phosphotransferase (APT) family kinase protein